MVSKLYQNTDSFQKTFTNTGGDVTWTLKNLSNGAGRISSQLDLGAYPRTTRYRYWARAKWQATPTQYQLFSIGVVGWDDDAGTSYATGNFTQTTDSGTRDGSTAIVLADLTNLLPLRPIVVDKASASFFFTSSGLVELPWRYIQLVGWNGGGSALTNTDGDALLRLTALPYESQ